MSNTRSTIAAMQTRRVALPLAVLLAAVLAACSDAPKIDQEKTATLIQPVARVELKVEAPAAEEGDGSPNGEAIYKAVCTACHAVGVAGAPKSGNADDWAPRIAKGLDANVDSVLNGLGAMPPRGGNPNLSDAEVRHAVVYLMNGAGGNFSAE